jgi:hypothetical protein
MQLKKEHHARSESEVGTLTRSTKLYRHAGPGYEMDKAGLVTPLEPDAEGSAINKGPGYFYQPFALAPGMGTDGFLGDDTAALTEDDVAYVCKVCKCLGNLDCPACLNTLYAFH